MPFPGGALRPHPAALASTDRGSLACSPPGGLHSDVSRCCKAVGRQSRCSRSPDARARHRRACARAGAADRSRPPRRRRHDRTHAAGGPFSHHAAARLWRIRIRLRRGRAGRCRHCERMRLDRLGLRSARLAPMAHRLLFESGAGRGLAGSHRARRREAVDGGYRLSGVGSFCSGCDNAQWQLLGGMIPQPGAAATPGFFLLRSADCVIDDNWHTMGLAGTGSKNIVARDVFVPAHRTLAFAELIDATATGMRANPNPLYRQSFLAVLPITIVSPVLGTAEGALADFLAMASVRTTRGAVAGGNRRMAELTTVQMRLAEAGACIDAARLLMFRDLAEAFETAARGDPISVDVRLRNRRDQAFCVRLLVGAIDALF